MEAKKKYVKPAFRFVTDLGSILECLYEVYGTDGELLLKGEKLSDTVICLSAWFKRNAVWWMRKSCI